MKTQRPKMVEVAPRYEDRLDREKRGRVVNEAQRIAAMRARVATITSGRPYWPSTGRYGARKNEAGANFNRPPSREAVFKVIGWTKAANAPERQARYVGRARDPDIAEQIPALDLENERGEVVVGKAAIRAEIASWQLLPDRDNLSAAARGAPAELRAKIPPKDRLARNQAVHLIYSVPSRSVSDPDRLRAALRGGLAETFGAAGHRYLFAIHTDHSARPHAHIVVKATTEPRADRKSRALRLRRDELHTLRHVLTEHARQHGIDVIATRREDRPELRPQIIEGSEPLRADRSWHQRMRVHQGRLFEKSAPNWYREFGLPYERRRMLDIANQPEKGEKQAAVGAKRTGFWAGLIALIAGTNALERAPDAPARGGYFQNFDNVRRGQARNAAIARGESRPLAALSGYFALSHVSPDSARTSFLAMYREAPKLALWAASNHPMAFGPTTGKNPDRLDLSILKELPADLRPAPLAWSNARERAQRDVIGDLRRAARSARTVHAAAGVKSAVAASLDHAMRAVSTIEPPIIETIARAKGEDTAVGMHTTSVLKPEQRTLVERKLRDRADRRPPIADLER